MRFSHSAKALDAVENEEGDGAVENHPCQRYFFPSKIYFGTQTFRTHFNEVRHNRLKQSITV
jgi:hypothetical protein